MTYTFQTCDCGLAHDSEHHFYVSVVDGNRKGFLLGPYATHREALDNVTRGTRLALNSGDFKAPWYGYGTASMSSIRRTVFGK